MENIRVRFRPDIARQYGSTYLGDRADKITAQLAEQTLREFGDEERRALLAHEWNAWRFASDFQEDRARRFRVSLEQIQAEDEADRAETLSRMRQNVRNALASIDLPWFEVVYEE